jgi:threonine dehydratase
VHHDGDHYSVSQSECFAAQVVQTTDMMAVTFASGEEAVRILHGVAHYTPVLTSCQLDALTGARVFLKCENFQRVGAFKFRGAYHAIVRLMSSQPSRMFAAVSSGSRG